MTYSHAETVDMLTRHYQFLTNYLPHLSPSDLLLPPLEGWSEITSDSLSRLNKNQTVINLLKHIPYIANSACHGHFAKDVGVIDYPFWVQVFERENDKVRPQGHIVIEEALPPHVVVLTHGDNYSSHLLLDTERGTITDWSMYRPAIDPETGVPFSEDVALSEAWRFYPTWSIKDYLKEREDKFRDLTWVPTTGGLARGIEERWPDVSNDHLDFLVRIYQVFGWPDPDKFDREGCRTVLIELEEKKKDEYFRKQVRVKDRKRPPMCKEDLEKFDWAVRVAQQTMEEEERARLAEIAETKRREEAEDAADEDYVPSEDGVEDCTPDRHDEEMLDAPGWVEVIDDDDYYEYAEQDNDEEDIETDLQFLTQAQADGEVTSLFGAEAPDHVRHFVHRDKESSI